MLKLVIISVVQCLFSAATQVLMKMAMQRMDKFSFTWAYFKAFLTNWPLLGSGICVIIATIMWFYILKHFELSIAYPLVSISYIFGMLAAIFIFHEVVPPTRWIGVALIMGGVFFMVR